jgi:hypothetical protein
VYTRPQYTSIEMTKNDVVTPINWGTLESSGGRAFAAILEPVAMVLRTSSKISIPDNEGEVKTNHGGSDIDVGMRTLK